MKIPHISLPTYYRLLIGDILPEDIDKCIYLDVDLCVCKDLSELFNIDLKDNYIAGVIAPSYFFSEKKHCKRLNLPTMKYYVNAGMLVMNLKEIKKDNMTKKFIELAKRNYASQDQDVLNIACFGKILTLPPKYNSMVARLKYYNKRLKILYKEKEIIEALNSPYIIHYLDEKKPWNSIGVYMDNYWWNIAKKTPYINSLFNRYNIYKNELKKWYFMIKKKQLNIDRPKTFNEKIQWLKLYDSIPIKAYLSDKYLLRKWVKYKIGEEYLIPLLGTYNKTEDLHFGILPNKFVIKCTHGNGYTIIVNEKSQLNSTDVKSKIDNWMNENYAFINGLELQYREIKPLIIIEEYIGEENEHLNIFKFFCFKGEPKFVSIVDDRINNNESILYDLKKNHLNYIINDHYLISIAKNITRLLEKMIVICSTLSEGFLYVRIDLYNIREKIYFGDMTFTSECGLSDIKSKKFERKLSSYLKIPKIIYNIDTGYYYKLNKSFSLYPYYITLIILAFKLLYYI